MNTTHKTDNARAPAVPQGEPVSFLVNGTRFKMSFFDDGDSSGDTFVKCFNNFRGELDGRWVALVPAEDDCHRNLIAAPSQEPAVPRGEQIKKALGKLKSAQMCHPNGVQFLIEEAIDALEVAPVPAPAQEVGLMGHIPLLEEVASSLEDYRNDAPWGSWDRERLERLYAIIAAIRAKGGK